MWRSSRRGATAVYAELKLWPAAVTARLVEAQLVADATYPNAAAVFGEGGAAEAARHETGDAFPVRPGFDPDQPRDPDGKWTAGGGGAHAAEPAEVLTQNHGPSDPAAPPDPLFAEGAAGQEGVSPRAPDGTPIIAATFKGGGGRGIASAIGALLGAAGRLWRRWRSDEPDDPEPVTPDAPLPAERQESVTPSPPTAAKQSVSPSDPKSSTSAGSAPQSQPDVPSSVQGDKPKLFTPAQNAAMEKLFKGGGKEGSVPGAQRLLDQIAQGGFEMPPDVTTDMLRTYRDVAISSISRGRDKNGVQVLRLRAVNQLLER